jgi:two-component system CheB/CheR fusion protein
VTAAAGCPIVGLGASAGGLEALGHLFRAVPAAPGLAFVVVIHLPPGRASSLAEILARQTSLAVAEAGDGEEVRPDRVYVIPPAALLTLAGGRLRVQRTGAERHHRNPIDVFFASLAADRGERAIGVVLSGAGQDGTLGIKAIRERGGLTLAQGADHTAPQHTSMPASAIASGLVDLVLPAEAMPAQLVRYARSLDVLEGLSAAERRQSAKEAAIVRAQKAIHAILLRRLGHDFSGYRSRSFLRRVWRRMQILQLDDIAAYVDHLERQPEEASLLFRDLLINVTSFFRDREAFQALETLAIPRLFAGKGAVDTLRVWVPGCATGEEAYSIAILLRERMTALPALPKVQVFATDIDEQALAVARFGRYPAALLDAVPPERLERFFTAEGGGWVVAREVRDMCIFSVHSVVRDPPFSRLDLISCRNLLIYMGPPLQAQVMPVFHYALRPGGFLFLGSAEGVGRQAELFRPLDKKHRVFQRRDDVGSLPPFALFVPDGRRASRPPDRAGATMTDGLTLRRAVEARVLERFAPAHVVVDGEGDVVYYSPRTGSYLEAAAGRPSRQLLAMARRGLRPELHAVLKETKETGRAARRERVAVEVDDHIRLVDLVVEPLADRTRNEPLFLVLFHDRGPAADRGAAAPAPRPADAAVEQLERELRDTRERLQSTIEEYETALEELKSANEELVSSNEELQSANEELETSKEEVQAVNEELQTVNLELAGKIEALNQANSDLRNLFESTQVAIVFLDRDLVIRSFTPAATRLFSLIGSDRGRPLAHIASQLDHAGLQDDLRAAVAGPQVIERRVSLRAGRGHHLMRILPYEVAPGRTEGVLLTFVEITAIVEAERHQRLLVHELNHRVRNMLAVVSALARQTLEQAASPAAFAQSFLGRIQAMARSHALLSREQWSDIRLDELVRAELEHHFLADEGRFTLEGPPMLLKPKAAVALGMVLHELSTNALKHGALAVPGGHVRVAWETREGGTEEGGAAGRRLLLHWRESGGAAVSPPARKGFGTELIEQGLAFDLQGRATLEFPPEGMRATLEVPLENESGATRDGTRQETGG